MPNSTDVRTEETPDHQELDQFLAGLRKLREEAGQPSLRAMSRTAHYSHTALSGVLTSGRLPSLDLTLAFVRACRGDENVWRARWTRTRDRIAMSNGAAPPGAALPGAAPKGPAPRARPPLRRPSVLVSGGIAAVAVAGLTLAMAEGGTNHPHHPALAAHKTVVCHARPDPNDHPLIPCDDSRFIADVTIPDGTAVRAKHTFVKTWEIENSGLVPWQGRFLQRQGLLQGPGLCTSVPRVPIPTTLPGHDVKISVTFTAPSLPGSCRVDWKMTDKAGQPYFPGLGGLYVVVNITG